MLYVLFSSGSSCYLLDSRKVKEVLPYVKIEAFSETSPFYLGVINYRETFIQVVDFEKLVTGKELSPKMHARIILIEREENEGMPLGLLVDSVESIIQPDQNMKPLSFKGVQLPFIQFFIKKDDDCCFVVNVELFFQYIDFNDLKTEAKSE